MGAHYPLGMPPDSYGKGLLLEAATGGYVPLNIPHHYPTFIATVAWSGAQPSDRILHMHNAQADTLVCIERLTYTEVADAENTSYTLYGSAGRLASVASAGTAITPAPFDSSDVLPAGITAEQFTGAFTWASAALILQGWAGGDDTQGHAARNLSGMLLPHLDRQPGMKPYTIRYNERWGVRLVINDPSPAHWHYVQTIFTVRPQP